MENVDLVTAFIAGLLSFLSPCVLPLVPAYIANLAGTTALDTRARASWVPTFIHSLFFILGFTIIFVIFGASVGLVGTAITAQQETLRIIGGIFVIILGLFLVLSYKIPWLNFEKRMHFKTGGKLGYLRSLLIGFAFAVGWTPCVGPILGAILTMAWSSQSVGQGALLLVIYSLGMGIPFIVIGLIWGKIMPLWKSINRYLGIISIVSGILLIIIGILIVTGNLAWLASLVQF
jgi:cytochrome c-type biogenesis protein